MVEVLEKKFIMGLNVDFYHNCAQAICKTYGELYSGSYTYTNSFLHFSMYHDTSW